ncbi:leucyl/phenylalanyl-tRNA--protein transferase [Lacinutrix sp. Bg11-31]|uniref:leucyl/phenylalanyl-tRNA--protein transferase n=1 Tax=Lacinutrix sp. Bg11-31 TaxID=2057808 RepID=UPI000C30E09C|nr:leucyl/phenylalanyl-tRNA--protein transferase [Lacinutrix sp. Bg11-31]AUC83190.1 leucyl/phenylalanyl-tRNA--protein transferase [Lacinutrix sp. Bg11-31]
MHILNQNILFPNVQEADEEGLLAVGGDLSVERLLLAYQSGIFPWFNEDEVVLWWSPDPRFVLFPKELKVSKSMKQFLRNCDFEITINKDFKSVITECAKAKRDGQAGTWITNNMIDAYCKLHEQGFAKSVEVWRDNVLVGGFYGVDLNNGVFCGESMFAKESNASKAAFITFIENTDYKLIDCQVYTTHLASLGAKDIPRDEFMAYLK